jgi:hypothetical protein
VTGLERVWHVFVLGGSGCHYFAILAFVA